MTKSDWDMNGLIGTHCVPLNRCVAPLPGYENYAPTLASATPSILLDCVENQPSSGIRDGKDEVLKLIYESSREAVVCLLGKGFPLCERKLSLVYAEVRI
jgi:hypothetical protein